MVLPEDDYKKILTDVVATRKKNGIFKYVPFGTFSKSMSCLRHLLLFFGTMHLPSEIAEIAVTYDLAIAKIALKIQNEEKPAFDHLLVHLGAFHIEMALFKAFEKVIEESGGPYILNECEVLAKGSMSSVCKEKIIKEQSICISY